MIVKNVHKKLERLVNINSH